MKSDNKNSVKQKAQEYVNSLILVQKGSLRLAVEPDENGRLPQPVKKWLKDPTPPEPQN